MPLLFNSLLHQVGIQPIEVRLLRHQDARAAKGRTPYELWRDDRPLFDRYQSQQGLANRGQLTASPYWASFLGTPTGTLFAGLYRAAHRGLLEVDTPCPHGEGVDLAGSCDVYDLALDERIADLAGRVVIEWGPGTRAWIQRADNQNKEVVEIRRAFTEPAFPGFGAFIEPLSRIEDLPATWIATLRASRGVYLLTCPKTREQYVGSASGEDGFHGRWLSYVLTGHGGNVGLKSRDPSDYQVAVLEVAGSIATMPEIVAMEARWKAKLRSLEMGLNRN